MISFLYHERTYYANVIHYGVNPTTYHVSIVTTSREAPQKLILCLGKDGFELSIYSPSLASNELVQAIGEKLPRELKADVA